jgi:hypothetical protein
MVKYTTKFNMKVPDKSSCKRKSPMRNYSTIKSIPKKLGHKLYKSKFKRFHYMPEPMPSRGLMATFINESSDGKPQAFLGIMSNSHTNWVRATRWVSLKKGSGYAYVLLKEVAEFYKKKGVRFSLKTRCELVANILRRKGWTEKKNMSFEY